MDEDVTETNWKLYRVAYSREPRTEGWCIFEQVVLNGSNSLEFVDGPWDHEQDAHAQMRLLNSEQGVNLSAKINS